MMTKGEFWEAIGDKICEGCPILTICLHSSSSLCDIDGRVNKIMKEIKRYYKKEENND